MNPVCGILLVILGPGIGIRLWRRIRARCNEPSVAPEATVISDENKVLGPISVPKTLPACEPIEPIPERNTPIHNIPYPPNPNFTGRELLLGGLTNALISGKTTALIQTGAVTGLGGVGKTQLALKYAYRHLDDYCVIWWVRSEEPSTLADDYASLAVKLGLLDDVEKIDARIEATRSWLEDNTKWLLIFDDAQKPGDLNNYLPRMGSGHVIITSRIPNWESLAKPFEVLMFERHESVEFLLKRTGLDDEKAADILAEALGDLPLALEQAGAYIKAAGKTFVIAKYSLETP